MNRCPYCNTPVTFPTEEDWYTCHACHGLIRLHTISAATRRVEAGRQDGNQIVTVQNPASSRPITSRPLTTRPVDTRSTPQRTTASSASTARSTFPPQTRPPSANPSSMNRDQVHAARQRISADVQALDVHNQSLLAELNQYSHNPDRVSALSAEMSRQSQYRRELMRMDELLSAREAALVAEQTARAAQAAAQRVAAPPRDGNPGAGCGISATVGAATMIGFAWYIGMPKWDPKTVMIMLGVGAGIALVGWIIGLRSK